MTADAPDRVGRLLPSSISAARKLFHFEWAGRDRANGARAQPLRLHRLVAGRGECYFVLTGLNARILRGRFDLRFLLCVGRCPLRFNCTRCAGGGPAADMKLVAASAAKDTREISNGSQSVAANSLRSWPFGVVVSTFL